MSEAIKGALLAVASGSVGAAIIKIIGDVIMWSKNRKAIKEDREEQSKKEDEQQKEEQLDEIKQTTIALREAMKYMMYDRIRYLALAYIEEGEIDFDDRRILNDMHRSYHSGLFGNGDLDILMAEVNRLPLIIKKN